MIHNRGGRHTRIEDRKLAGKRIYEKKKRVEILESRTTSEWDIMAAVISNPDDEGLLSCLEPVQIARVEICV